MQASAVALFFKSRFFFTGSDAGKFLVRGFAVFAVFGYVIFGKKSQICVEAFGFSLQF